MPKQILITAAAALSLALPFAGIAKAEPFKIVALGDMPYGDPEKVYPPFEALIGKINSLEPELVINIGDTKSGGTPCSDKMLDDQLNFLNSFEAPTLYTPGDNEWTDCHRKNAGGFDPLDRLAYIRRTYFTEPKSFGKKKIDIERQSEADAENATYVENGRLFYKDVMFITTHVVGSNNNLEARDPKAAMEFFARDAANITWLKSSFAAAQEQNAKAIVLAIHADMFEFDFNSFGREGFLRHSGFTNFADALVTEANSYGKPILLVFGDSHKHKVFYPFPKTAKTILAMEVYGDADMHAVEIAIDPDDAAPFSFRTVLNPQPLAN